MLIDRGHIGWGLVTLAATAAVTVVYLANNDPEVLPLTVSLPAWLGPVPPLRSNVGATPLGLIYGTIALVIFIFAALLGWRRSHPTWKLGRIQIWLKAHIWLTIFTIPLVLLHSGFHGGGLMTELLLALYAFVMISGFWGLALQNIVPRIMREYLPQETIFEQIPYIRGQLIAKAQSALVKLVELSAATDSDSESMRGGAGTLVASAPRADSTTAVLAFLEKEALPYLQATHSRRLRLRRRQVSDDLFGAMSLQVPELLRPSVEQIRELCNEKRTLDFQVRLHRWLHGWLLVHAPTSILLVVFTLWHAFVAAFTYA